MKRVAPDSFPSIHYPASKRLLLSRTMAAISHLHVNGSDRPLNAEGERPLLEILRDELDLIGAKYGCGEGQCGACTVLIDDKPVRSCLTRASAVGDGKIRTVEGLEKDGTLHPVQQAFLDEDAFQCGYCTCGMILSAVALLEAHPQPTDDQFHAAMEGSICRCGSFNRIRAAVKRASDTLANR